jgi:hypothetical protein
MFRFLYFLCLVTSCAEAEENICDVYQKSIGHNYITTIDFLIVLEQYDELASEPYVRFEKQPNESYQITKWIEVPEGSVVELNSITLRHEECKRFHGGKPVECWVYTARASYMQDNKEYDFMIHYPPEITFKGCKPFKEILNWAQ